MKLRLVIALAILIFYILAYKLPDNAFTLFIAPILLVELLLYKTLSHKRKASLLIPLLYWNIIYIVFGVIGLVIGFLLFGSLDFT